MLNRIKKNDALALRLRRVEEIMYNQIKSRHNNVQNTISAMIGSGGKRLRPAFVLLGSDFGSIHADELYEAAAGIEMLHMATLIHDDIIDEAFIRRGMATAQSRFGKDYAVFMGDFLLNRSFRLISKGCHSQDALEVMEKIFYGEMLQYNNRYSRRASIPRYLRIASNKTASLFAVSLYLGAKISGCDDSLCNMLRKIGFYYGITFQIIDDILDFTASEGSVGKSVQNDMKMGFYTLPVIYTAQSDGGKTWKLIDAGEFDQLSCQIEAMGGIVKTAALASIYLEKAHRLISKLPDNDAKVELSGLFQSLNHTLVLSAQTRISRVSGLS
ncbi:MAG: Polyprenyl synthetase [Bacillota bacterium]|jgi:heptaprenyl diphosphate synthase|nr:Polyprenyl synthetase [Bacillota bacterium]